MDKASGEAQGKLTVAAAPPKRDPGKEVLRPIAVEMAEYLREEGAKDVADIEGKFQERLKDVSVKVVLSIFKTLFKKDVTTGLWSAAPQKAVSTGQFKRLTRLNRKTPSAAASSAAPAAAASSAAPAAAAPAAPAAPAAAAATAAAAALRPEIEAWIQQQIPQKQHIARVLMARKPNWSLGSLKTQTGLHYTGNPKAQTGPIPPASGQ